MRVQFRGGGEPGDGRGGRGQWWASSGKGRIRSVGTGARATRTPTRREFVEFGWRDRVEGRFNRRNLAVVSAAGEECAGFGALAGPPGCPGRVAFSLSVCLRCFASVNRGARSAPGGGPSGLLLIRLGPRSRPDRFAVLTLGSLCSLGSLSSPARFAHLACSAHPARSASSPRSGHSAHSPQPAHSARSAHSSFAPTPSPL